MLWGIILFCCLIGGFFILWIVLDDSKRPAIPSSVTPEIVQRLAPLDLNGLTIKEQVTTLRAESVRLGQRLVTEFPRQAESHILLGNTYRQLGQSTQAVESWNEALTLDAQHADVYTYLAILAEEKGDAEQALGYWKKVLLLRPELPGLRDSLANTLMTLNQWDDAIEVLNEEIRLSPGSARTHYLLGRAYSQQNRYTEAAFHYEKTVAMDPNQTHAYYELATALMRSGQRQKAQNYRRLFSEQKQQEKAGASYGYTEQEDLLKAKKTLAGLCAKAADMYVAVRQDDMVLALLKRVVLLEPDNLASRKRLAARYQALGLLPEALDECEQIARLTPDDPVCQMLIGSLNLRMGRYTRAELAYEKMIKLAPGLSAGYHELVKIYLKTHKNLPKARSLAEQAVQLDPTAGNYYMLGLAYYENGDKSSAIKALKRAVELDPGNQTYQSTYYRLTSGK
jgi:protein O-GlcNAc transferase